VRTLGWLKWADVLKRDTRVQLSVTGKGGRVRQTREQINRTEA